MAFDTEFHVILICGDEEVPIFVTVTPVGALGVDVPLVVVKLLSSPYAVPTLLVAYALT